MGRWGFPVAAVAALALLSSAPPARACGGCFAPPSPEISLVTGHRMVFSVNATRTVLWDQFQYSGSPEDFSWVLPVKPGAFVEASTDAWFEALDAFTTTQVIAPTLNCASGGGRSEGCGSSSDEGGSSGGQVNPPGVEVVHQGTVGPYETVTLSSQDPQALRSWLESNGYLIPAEIDPIIDAYVAEGFDFIALRLSPGQGVQQMTPVRVVTPGGDSSLPLRMVAAGVGSFVEIVLFVIAEDRYTLPDLAEVSILDKDLIWDFQGQRSNFTSLRTAALAKNGSESFLTAFARDKPFSQPLTRPDGQVASFSFDGVFSSATLLSELYFERAARNDGKPSSCPAPVMAFGSGATVSDGSAFECEGYTDLAAAMIGMRPLDVWLTRLEMNLPSIALDHDCVVAPAVAQTPLSNWHVAMKSRNAPCAEPVFSGNSRPATVPIWMFGVLSGAWLGRRSVKRRKPR